MKLRVKGRPYNIRKPLVGIVTTDLKSSDKKKILISNDFLNSNNFLAQLTTNDILLNKKTKKSIIYALPYLNHLKDGDIIAIGQDGNIKTMYRHGANINFLLVTERCNSNCLMCSQPPKNKDDISYLYNINKKVISLLPKNLPELGITGGEPTLLGKYFFNLLSQIKIDLPQTETHVLTNGRSFAWEEMAKKTYQTDNKKVMYGIPLYSDDFQTHDYIVQAKDAFSQTILGIYNLEKYKLRTEIRIVLHKLTIPRLIKLAKYIYMNLPFVEQVCFMGLEYTGYTPFNSKKLWIDPIEYMSQLNEAVQYLDSHKIKVNIYNLQLCILPKSLWKFSRKSISDWKNIYFDECKNCDELKNCGGLFTSHLKKHSEFIKSIKYEKN